MSERSTGYVARDFQDFPFCSLPFETAWDEVAFPLLTLKEAVERSEHDIANGLDPLSMAMKGKALPTYQNGKPSCWWAALTMGMKVSMAQSGQPVPRLSQTAGYCLTTGYRNRGGNCHEAMPVAIEMGLPTVDFWPENDMSRSNDTAEMRANAGLHRVIECMPLPSEQHKWTALAYRWPLWSGYANIGHAILSARLLPDANQPGSLDINSWNKNAAAATEWQESWLNDRDVIWPRKGRDFKSFETYAIRVMTVAA